MLILWLMLTWKIVGGWIQWLDMEIFFKFLVNQMKIDDFRKLADVDLKRVTALSHGHVTCGNVSISSAERFSMYVPNKMQTRTTYVCMLLIA